MSAPAAFHGNYADLKFVKTRSVAVVSIEIPIEAAEAFVAAFGTPRPGAEVPVALARMKPTTVRQAPKLSASDKRTWSDMPLAQQAAIRCVEPAFRRFLAEEIDRSHDIAMYDGDMAADTVRRLCGVTSRKHLAESSTAAARWVELDTRFQLWMRAAA